MAQKYQNEIAPIFYYGISTKTNEKDLKIPNLQPTDWKSPYWMTLYLEAALLESVYFQKISWVSKNSIKKIDKWGMTWAVSYTHLRAHET